MRILLSTLVLILLFSCNQGKTKLPFIGNHEINGTDTIYHQIPDFSFTNQDSLTITNETFSDKIYVADFFFMSCPAICPKVKKQMLRMYERFESEDQFMLVSHTLAPKYDTVESLKTYSTNLGVDSKKWHFLHGEKDVIWDINSDYLVAVQADENSPGGIAHSGKVVLIDKNRHIRAFCDGTDPESVDAFFGDIELLLKEYEK